MTSVIDAACRGQGHEEASPWLQHLWGRAPEPEETLPGADAFFATLAALVALQKPPVFEGDHAWSAVTSSLRAFACVSPSEELDTQKGNLSDDGAALRVVQLVLRSLHATEVHQELRDARHATRAAYAESMPVLEYFAYWALARARRRVGTAHAAARIASACARVVPSVWRPLLDWELVLAGGDEAHLERPLSHHASVWQQAMRDPSAGRSFDDAMPSRFARERRVLADGFEGVARDDEELALRLAAAFGEASSATTPAVWRISSEGRTLLWARANHGHVSLVLDGAERVGEAIVELGAAPHHELECDALFRRVYGFDYDAKVHDGVLRTLVYRMRLALGEIAELKRDASTIRLCVKEPFVCPAPESAAPLDDRLLRLIALSPGISAQQLADQTGAHLRSVQRSLRLLGETGACESRKEGRRHSFYVEDTTFSEPTHFSEATR